MNGPTPDFWLALGNGLAFMFAGLGIAAIIWVRKKNSPKDGEE